LTAGLGSESHLYILWAVAATQITMQKVNNLSATVNETMSI